jgi:hypothetical protein
MANPDHVEIVKQGAEAIREWRENNPGVRLDLSAADLREADLSLTDLRDADLTKAELRESNLSGANLEGTNFRGADLSGAKLICASVTSLDPREVRHKQESTDRTGGDMESLAVFIAEAYGKHVPKIGIELVGRSVKRANFGHAILEHAEICGEDFDGADFSSARFGSTVFRDVDLSGAKKLEDATHGGPSSVDVDTLYKSKGKIPTEFLQGCGVPSALIEDLPDLLAAQGPIQFHSCFISHSSKDEDFCKRLHSRMRDEKLRVWFAPEEMKGGRKIHEQIDEAIRVYDKLLLVLSEASMDSNWVANEIRAAFKQQEATGRRMLFPIRLVPYETLRDWQLIDAASGTDLAEEIRQYYVPDFSNWKDPDAFEAAFGRLLDDLKAGE